MHSCGRRNFEMFPAYKLAADQSNETCTSENADWLSLKSFQPEAALAIQEVQAVGEIAQEDDSLSDASYENERGSDHSLEKRGTKRIATAVEEHPVTDVSSDESSRERHHRKHKRKKKSKHKHKHKAHKRKEEKQEKEKPSKETSRPPSELPKNKVFLDDMPGLTVEHAYRIDRQPDNNNLSFESLYKLHVAKRRRLGNVCLGSRPGHMIVLSGSKSDQRRNTPSRYFDKENIRQLYDEKSVLNLSASKEDNATLPADGSLEHCLLSEREEGKYSVANPLGVYDPATECYIQGKANVVPVSEPGSTHVEQTLTESQGEKLRRQTEQYNKKLRDNPHDIQLWLDFIKFQDALSNRKKFSTGIETSVDKDYMKTEDRMLLEKKLAIFDRALESNSGCVKLKTAQLDLCRGVWETDKLIKEWKKLLFIHANDTVLWKKYLIFLNSMVSQFTVSKTVAAYGKCISTLSSVLRRELISHDPMPDAENQLLDIFIQMCHFLQDAGHLEKAVANYQAVIEFNLFCPGALLSSSFKERIEHFESFWDSSAPRFGENGAIGWRNWALDKEKSSQMPTMKLSGDEESILEDGIIAKTKNDRTQAWLSLESSRESRHWLPWKPDPLEGDTEEDCEDPDRLVLSDDVTPTLMTLTNDQLKMTLVKSYLMILGVRPPDLGMHAGEFSDLINFHNEKNALNANLSQKVITNVFRQATSAFADGNVTELLLWWLSHEEQQCVSGTFVDNKAKRAHLKEVKKFAKSLLKEEKNRNNLLLWNAYAKLEWRLGKEHDARNVYDTAIKMYAQTMLNACSENVSVEEEFCVLYHTYASLESGITDAQSEQMCQLKLKRNRGEEKTDKVNRCLCILASMVSGMDYEEPTCDSMLPTHVLKTRRLFQSKLENIMAQKSNAHTALWWHWTNCFAMFEYLTSGMAAAARVFEQVLQVVNEKFQDSLSLTKALFISHLHLACYHVNHHIASLTSLKELLNRALALFPECPLFLRLFVDLELQSHASGRLRQYFTYGQLNRSISVQPWMFALDAELSRFDKLKLMSNENMPDTLTAWSVASPVEIGVTHRIRSVFEHAVESDPGRHCVDLWRRFIKFELDQGSQDKALAVFYRSLQKCPWSKALYMDGVRHFPSKCQEILDLMTEKELRLRVPLEELDLLIDNANDEADTSS